MTEIWWWPAPADGEIVPDHPPIELSAFIVEDSIVVCPPTATVTYELVEPDDTPDVNPA